MLEKFEIGQRVRAWFWNFHIYCIVEVGRTGEKKLRMIGRESIWIDPTRLFMGQSCEEIEDARLSLTGR